MNEYTGQSWACSPYEDFYKPFYGKTEENDIAAAIKVLTPKLPGYRAKFAAFDKKAAEGKIYSEFVSIVNDILDLAATTPGLPAERGVGRLRCYNTYNKYFTTRHSRLAPDVNIMEAPSAPEPPVALSSNTRPVLQEALNTVSHSSVPPASSSGNQVRSENIPSSGVQSTSTNGVKGASRGEGSLGPTDLQWWRVVVTMDVKPAHTPGKAKAGISLDDQFRGSWSAPGVRSVSTSQPPAPPPPHAAQPRSSTSSLKRGSEPSPSDQPSSKRLKLEGGVSSPVEPLEEEPSVPPDSTPLLTLSESVGAHLNEPGAGPPGLPGTSPHTEGITVVLKPTKDDIQLGRYLTEVMSTLGNRTHAFGCILRGDLFHITYADPNGLARSERRKLSEPPGEKDNVLEFALFIYGLSRCQASQLGFDHRFTDPSGRPPLSLPATLEGLSYKVQGHNLTIRETLHVERSLCGRHTRVFRVDYPMNGVVEEVVLKLSYPYATRPRECHLLLQAKTILMQKMGHASGIPKVFLEEQGRLVTQGFREAFTTGEVDKFALDRCLEILVMERLYPLHTLRTPLYIRGAEHIADTIGALSEANFYHRDISSGNLMLRIHDADETGKRLFDGVLSDFDLAVDQNSGLRDDANKQHWTGTLPFLAKILFEEPDALHRIRYELESLFYVIIWDTCLWSGGMPVGENAPEDPAGRKWIEKWRDSNTILGERSLLADRLNGERVVANSLLHVNETFRLWKMSLYTTADIIHGATHGQGHRKRYEDEDSDEDEEERQRRTRKAEEEQEERRNHPTLAEIKRLLKAGRRALRNLPLNDQAKFEPRVWELHPIPDWRPIKLEEPSDIDLNPDS